MKKIEIENFLKKLEFKNAEFIKLYDKNQKEEEIGIVYNIMNKQNKISNDNNITIEEYDIFYKEFDSYACSFCKSEIEIESIIFNNDNEEDFIIYNCFDKCGKIKISLNNFLQKLIINTYLNEKCSVCNKKQINDDNIFFYCIECKKIFCNQCKYVNNCNANKDIKINEINNQCLSHYNKFLDKRNDFDYYCINDKKKLCDECLNDGSHINHSKIYSKEISLIKIYEKDNISKEIEIILFQNIMDYYKNKRNKIFENKRKKLKELYDNIEKRIKLNLANLNKLAEKEKNIEKNKIIQKYLDK